MRQNRGDVQFEFLTFLSNRTWGGVSAACLSLVVLACSSVPEPIVQPASGISLQGNFVLLPFEDQNTAAGRENYPGAADVMKNAIESALVARGVALVTIGDIPVEPARVDLSGGTIKHIPERIRLEDALVASKSAGGDAAIFGTVEAFYQGDDGGGWTIVQETTIGISLKCMDTSTKQVLWTARHIRKPGGMTGWKNDPNTYASDVASELVNALFERAH